MKIEVKGLEVKFPFEPYPLQRDYMTKVIEALQNEQNAVLESPTGEKF
jgi:regulator of telomere elongation helicase 1